MAAAAHVTTRVYGMIEGSPPYTDGKGNAAFSRAIPFDYAGLWSIPTTGVNYVPLANGFAITPGVYVYSVIQVAPSGLAVHGQQYVTDTSVATLATDAG